MSFFSIVELAPGVRLMSREMRNLSRCGDAYRDHQLLWRLFRDGDGRPGEDETPGAPETRDFIFRRRVELHSTLSYYVVSNRRPRPAPGLLTVVSKPYHPQLKAGDRVGFDLRANPVVSRKRSGHGSSAHHDLLMDAKFAARAGSGGEIDGPKPALTWLASRAKQWGLQPHLETVITGAHTRNRMQPGAREIIFTTLDYTGSALVVDPDLLNAALLHGVGKKRGFGCGLLLVRRAG
jgi:CRISPR system Cascade subunit CasE